MENFEQPVLKSISNFLGPGPGHDLFMDKAQPKNLPVWVKDFAEFYRIGVSPILTINLVKVSDKADIEKILNLYKVLKNFKMDKVLILADNLSSKMKLELLKARIPHITSSGSIFAPELGVIYRDSIAKSDIHFEQREKLLPLSQKLIALYLINPRFFEGKNTLSDLVNYLAEEGYEKSPSTLSRAFHQLESLEIIRFEGFGPNKRAIFLDKELVWSRLLELESETVVKKIGEFYLPADAKFPWVYSGDSALARISELNESNVETIAMSLSDFKKWQGLPNERKGQPRGDFGNRPGVIIEIWRDDVTFLSKEKCMNPIELALALRRTREPRTQIAISEVINKLGLNSNLLWEHR